VVAQAEIPGQPQNARRENPKHPVGPCAGKVNRPQVDDASTAKWRWAWADPARHERGFAFIRRKTRRPPGASLSLPPWWTKP